MKAKVNKSQLIRECMKRNPSQPPVKIAEIMKKDHGIKVSGQYVSTIKSNMRKVKKLSSSERQSRISQGMKLAWKRRHAAASSRNGDTLHAAVDFVKAVGGLDKAKATIDMIEEIGKAL